MGSGVKDEFQTKRIREQAEKIWQKTMGKKYGQGAISFIEAILDDVYEWGVLDERFSKWGESEPAPLIERIEAKPDPCDNV